MCLDGEWVAGECPGSKNGKHSGYCDCRAPLDGAFHTAICRVPDNNGRYHDAPWKPIKARRDEAQLVLATEDEAEADTDAVSDPGLEDSALKLCPNFDTGYVTYCRPNRQAVEGDTVCNTFDVGGVSQCFDNIARSLLTVRRRFVEMGYGFPQRVQRARLENTQVDVIATFPNRARPFATCTAMTACFMRCHCYRNHLAQMSDRMSTLRSRRRRTLTPSLTLLSRSSNIQDVVPHLGTATALLKITASMVVRNMETLSAQVMVTRE